MTKVGVRIRTEVGEYLRNLVAGYRAQARPSSEEHERNRKG